MEHIHNIFIMASIMVLMTSLPVAHALTASEKNLMTSSGDVEITESGNNYKVKCDGLPSHDTADFPTNYNPNTITAQSYSYDVPITPTAADDVSCLPMGPIGFARNGVPFFSPYTAEGENAVEGDFKETFDDCDGHPDQQGSYHYHQGPSCVTGATGRDTLVGLALDGYPIYSSLEADGTEITSKDLDACHGRTVDGSYRYHLTADFPYVLGCYHGEVTSQVKTIQQRPGCDTAISTESDAVRFMPFLSTLVMLALVVLSLN